MRHHEPPGLDEIGVLAGRPRVVTVLEGGLTNRNYRVQVADGDYVVRWAATDTSLLEVDRVAEHADTTAAHASGVGPAVYEHRPDLGLLVIGFLQGRSLSNDSFADPAVLGRAAAAVRRLHAGPRFTRDLDMFARRERYLATIDRLGLPLPRGYLDHEPAWQRVRRALAATAGPTVPSNNDLLAENFIDNGERCWIIDYEYASNADPAFDIANTTTECGFTAEMTEAYAEAYFGTLTKALLARVRLQALASAYGWSLWGVIQAGVSSLDYDFTGWGSERYEKAVAVFEGPEFSRLLDEVGG